MKPFFALFLIFPISGFAQNCSLKKNTDPFTHETKISTGFVSFENGGVKLSVSVDAGPNDIDIFLWITSGTNCFDDASTAQVIYEGERVKANFRNAGSMNCEGAFHINFRNLITSPSALDKLGAKKIKTIHLSGANKTVLDIAFSEDQKQKFMEMVSCVTKEGKTLIKQ